MTVPFNYHTAMYVRRRCNVYSQYTSVGGCFSAFIETPFYGIWGNNVEMFTLICDLFSQFQNQQQFFQNEVYINIQ